MTDGNAEIKQLREFLVQGWRADLADQLASHLINRGEYGPAREDLDEAVELFQRLVT